MTFTVTIESLVLMLLAVVALVVGIYLLMVLKNANALIANVNKTLTDNQQQINGLLQHLEELSGHTVQLSSGVKRQFEKNELLVSSIFQTGADSMLLINDATSRIRTLVSNFNEIIKLVNRFFKKMK